MSGNDNPNNEYEIFVSYSHRDNLLLIDYFIQQLREAAKLGKISLSKFIDEQDIVGDWETSILSHLESSNIFMPFITPTYLESDECIKELSTFVALARRSEEVKLIAPVFWKTVDENELPDNGYSREAYRYLNRVQGITDNGKKDLSSKDPEAIPFVKIYRRPCRHRQEYRDRSAAHRAPVQRPDRKKRLLTPCRLKSRLQRTSSLSLIARSGGMSRNELGRFYPPTTMSKFKHRNRSTPR